MVKRSRAAILGMLAQPPSEWPWDSVVVQGETERQLDEVVGILALFDSGQGELNYFHVDGTPYQMLMRQVAACTPSVEAVCSMQEQERALLESGKFTDTAMTGRERGEAVWNVVEAQFAPLLLPFAMACLTNRQQLVFLGSNRVPLYDTWLLLKAAVEICRG